MLTYKEKELDAGSSTLQTLSDRLSRIDSMMKKDDQRITNLAVAITNASKDVTDAKSGHRAVANERKSIENTKEATIEKAGELTGDEIAANVVVKTLGFIVLPGPLALIALGFSVDDSDKRKGEAREAFEAIQEESRRLLAPLENKIQELTTIESAKQSELTKAELQHQYALVLGKIFTVHGLHVARQLQQFAKFNGTTIEDIFSTVKEPVLRAIKRLAIGQPEASDISILIDFARKEPASKKDIEPVNRTLRQFVNHLLIPNQTYFDILASYADDARSHNFPKFDVNVESLHDFPPLEALGHKPVSFSGRLQDGEKTPKGVDSKTIRINPEGVAFKENGENLANVAQAKSMTRKTIADNAVYSILQNDGLHHIRKMEKLVAANEEQMDQFSELFSKIEHALNALADRSEELAEKSQLKQAQTAKSIQENKILDSRIREIQARNTAKQKAATRGSIIRGGTAVAAGIGLAMFDGGATAVLTAKGMAAKAGIAKMLVGKGLKDSVHSITYGVGQGAATSLENDLLDDYMHSLQLQKVDTSALQKELEGLEEAIMETAKSEKFQALLKDEAKKAQIAETLLLRSLIRNGYNNSLEIEEVCQQAGVASIDAFLGHYKGTRLGLALKKHCHGLADSNDISVILAEANCLRGAPDGFDRVLKEYVEETMKPNIGSYYSKASKMDVISRNNLTGFGNELHFSAEMQMETNRAVRILTANEYGMSVVGREDVRGLFDFWLHRHGDERLYDDKIRDGEMSDEYPDKRVSHLPADQMKRFVDMAKRSVASGRKSFPKVGDMFMRVCAHEYFLPQAVKVGGKDNIFTDYPESPSAYPMVNTVVGEFIRKMSFAHLDDYRGKVGERLDNVVASAFIEFFRQVGELHHEDDKLVDVRTRVKDAANYDDYAPVFDRYTKRITGDALQRFDLFLDIYKQALEKQYEVATEEDRRTLDEQIEKVKGLADGKLNPDIVRPGTQAARLRAYDESHLGENLSGRV
jgi:hypothetical protein